MKEKGGGEEREDKERVCVLGTNKLFEKKPFKTTQREGIQD